MTILPVFPLSTAANSSSWEETTAETPACSANQSLSGIAVSKAWLATALACSRNLVPEAIASEAALIVCIPCDIASNKAVKSAARLFKEEAV